MTQIKKSLLYTRTGDDGTTALANGLRTHKTSARLEAYGTVDELNSWLGVIASRASVPPQEAECLHRLMNTLFNLGAYLATPGAAAADFGITEDSVTELERAIDNMDSLLEPMHCFILPTGATTGAFAQVARAVCRRAERRILALAQSEEVDRHAIKLINRLSDYLFALARLLNQQKGVADTAWDKDFVL